jgi:hypothetical protein
MSRNALLASGVVLWTAAAFDALVHLAGGDFLAPTGMAIVLAAWLAVRRYTVRTRAAEPVPVEV